MLSGGGPRASIPSCCIGTSWCPERELIRLLFFFNFLFYIGVEINRASLVAQLVRNPPAMQETGRSPGEGIGYPLQYSWASLVAQLVQNLPAMRETWVLSLSWEDPMEKGTATHSRFLAWRIPWTA